MVRESDHKVYACFAAGTRHDKLPGQDKTSNVSERSYNNTAGVGNRG